MKALVVALIVFLTACDDGAGAPLTDAASAAILAIEPATLELGVIEIGVATAPQAITIRNVGSSTTGVVLSTSTAMISIAENDCVTLAPQASCTAYVVVTPAAAGSLTGDVRALAVVGGTAAVAPVVGAGGHRLTVARFGGVDARVTSTPAGIDCGTSCETLIVASTVELAAEATFPTAFARWAPQGDQPACVGSGTCTLVLTGPTTIEAIFEVRSSISVVIAGMGAGVVSSGATTCVTGTCVYPSTDGARTMFTPEPVSGSGFSGWSGACSGTGPCTAITAGATTVTATFSPQQGITWVRTSRVFTRAADLARTTAGVVYAGTQERSATETALYVGHYQADGTPGVSFIDDPTTGIDRAIRVVEHPAGGVVVLACVGGSTEDACPLALRRYDAAGGLLWSVAPGGTAIMGFLDRWHGLAVDASGNLYVTGADTGPYLVSYDAAGAERWRRRPTTNPAVTSLLGVATRGDVVAVVGALATSPSDGWIGTYDRAGVAGWQRTVVHPQDRNNFALDDVAIDSDGDIVFGGDATNSFGRDYIFGAIAATGANEQWRDQTGIRGTGQLRVDRDDTVVVWLGQPTSAFDDSWFHRYSEAGTSVSVTAVYEIGDPSGLVADGGAVYLTGATYPGQWPAIQRR